MHGHAKHISDDFAYAVAVIGPFVSLPQLYDVWIKHVTLGVSITSWTAFGLLSLFWCYYGLKQKEKPLIISQGLWVIMNFAVVIGVFIYR